MSEFAAPMPVLARYAVMVDVGYIYAAAGELLFGTSSRREYRVDVFQVQLLLEAPVVSRAVAAGVADPALLLLVVAPRPEL